MEKITAVSKALENSGGAPEAPAKAPTRGEEARIEERDWAGGLWGPSC